MENGFSLASLIDVADRDRSVDPLIIWYVDWLREYSRKLL